MAVGLGTGVPWLMCKEEDAPDPVVSPSLIYCGVLSPSLLLTKAYLRNPGFVRHRLIHAMAFTAMHSLLIDLTSLQCGQRLGVAGV